MAHWLTVPELEALLHDMSVQPADMDVLRAAVGLIAEKLDRRVKTVGGKSRMVTFESPGLTFYNVAVVEKEYHVIFQHEAAQLNRVFDHTPDLAWRICGYPCSPADMRKARVQAARDGLTDLKKLPPQYFRQRRRSQHDDHK
jgi:hypothetical protein